MNVFYNTIVLVKEIARSKAFYREALGLKVELEYDTIVFFENHFTIHDGEALLETVYKSPQAQGAPLGRKNIVIYFETDDIASSLESVESHNGRIIHGIEEQAWGQKVFRFLDPDGHIVEIGEAMHLEHLKKSPGPAPR